MGSEGVVALYRFNDTQILEGEQRKRELASETHGVNAAPPQRAVRDSATDDAMALAPEQLSAYELERFENIKRNNSVLESLGLGSGLVPTEKPMPKKKQRTAAPKPPAVPVRKSSRIVTNEEENLAKAAKEKEAQAQAAAMEEDDDEEDRMPMEKEQLHRFEWAAYEVLKQARLKRSRELEVPSYYIANNRTLCEMVRRVCASEDELLECWGMADKKVKAHGSLLLAALRPHVTKLKEGQSAHAAAREAARQEGAVTSAADDGAGMAKAKVEEAGGEGAAATGGGGGGGGGGAAATVPWEEEEAWEERMPATAAELLPAEWPIYEVLIRATHVRAEEIGEQRALELSAGGTSDGHWIATNCRWVNAECRRVPPSAAECRRMLLSAAECH